MSSIIKECTRSELTERCKEWKQQGLTVGYTSGVFDLVHPGHVSYLEEAKNRCDLLIVGVNTDSSVREIKGAARPICDEASRSRVIAALACVDYVFLFSERNNNENVRLLEPDIYFKAGDYTREKLSSAALVEAYGGRIELLQLEAGKSSTSIIDRVLSAHGMYGVLATDPADSPERPAVFLDRDGTLIEHVEYLHEPEKMRVLDGAVEGLQLLQKAGYILIVVTNQPGIGLGYFTVEDLFRVNKALLRELSGAGILISKLYFSPYSKADNAPCRKPATGMIDRACAELSIDMSRSFVIGDATSDIQLAHNAGIRSLLIGSGDDELYDVKPTRAVNDLLEAARFILDQEGVESSVSTEGARAENRRLMSSDLEAIGKLAAKIGHDFNNILGSVRGCADLIASKAGRQFEGENPFERQIKIINSAIDRGISLTGSLRGYVRPGPVEGVEVQLDRCLEDIARSISEGADVDCDVDLNVGAPVIVEANEYQLTKVIMGVCLNAIDAMKNLQDRTMVLHLEKRTLKAREVEDLAAGDYAQISIIDHGKGISDSEIKEIFNGFYTTKQTGIGVGIGLTIPMGREILKKHKGAFIVSSQEDVGTAVHLFIPVLSRET